MSKKDYQMIARTVNKRIEMMRNFQNLEARLCHYKELIGDLADAFAQDNPRFNRALFTEACETGSCKGMRKAS